MSTTNASPAELTATRPSLGDSKTVVSSEDRMRWKLQWEKAHLEHKQEGRNMSHDGLSSERRVPAETPVDNALHEDASAVSSSNVKQYDASAQPNAGPLGPDGVSKMQQPAPVFASRVLPAQNQGIATPSTTDRVNAERRLTQETQSALRELMPIRNAAENTAIHFVWEGEAVDVLLRDPSINPEMGRAMLSYMREWLGDERVRIKRLVVNGELIWKEEDADANMVPKQDSGHLIDKRF